MTNDIAQLDEMLELLFWLEGEGLEGNATLAGISRFLAQAETDARVTLSRLVERGDVVATQDRYALTETGRGEAARRFVEDFSGLVAQGHGECNDPNCDCRTSPGGAADCQAHKEGHA
jgi:hypothetical protein